MSENFDKNSNLYFKRSIELDEMKERQQQLEAKLSERHEEIGKLTNEKEKLCVDLRQSRKELNDLRENFKSSSMFIENSCKINNILKDERDTLEKAAKEAEDRLRAAKNSHKKLKLSAKTLRDENQELNKKLNDLLKNNKSITTEKEDYIKVYLH